MPRKNKNALKGAYVVKATPKTVYEEVFKPHEVKSLSLSMGDVLSPEVVSKLKALYPSK